MKQTNEHLKEVNETYTEHLMIASGYGFKLMLASFACFVHAIFPSLFTNYVSNLLEEIRKDVSRRKTKK